jgi:hypothetical protein
MPVYLKVGEAYRSVKSRVVAGVGIWVLSEFGWTIRGNRIIVFETDNLEITPEQVESLWRLGIAIESPCLDSGADTGYPVQPEQSTE